MNADAARRLRNPAAWLLAWIVLVAGSCGWAQSLQLRVDGRPVGEVRTDLVPGTSYAPADALADGFGARLAATPGGAVVAFELAGRFVRIDVVALGEPARRAGAVRLDGRVIGDQLALRGDDAIWVPVAAVARAFAAEVAFLSEEREVWIVTARPEVLDASVSGGDALSTLSVRLSGPVAHRTIATPVAGRIEVVLPRASLVRARTLDGGRFLRVDLLPDGDQVRLRIDAPGSELETIALPDGAGTILRVRARPQPADADVPATTNGGRTIALDVGSAGVDGAAMRTAEGVAQRLRAAGVSAQVIRSGGGSAGAAARLRSAAESDLYVALQATTERSDELRVWVLGEAEDDDARSYALQRNARDALADGAVTDALRRELLVGLVPDLAVGRRAAETVAAALFQTAGYRTGAVREAPIATLREASGRGLLVELPDGFADDAAFLDAFAAALRSAASGAR